MYRNGIPTRAEKGRHLTSTRCYRTADWLLLNAVSRYDDHVRLVTMDRIRNWQSERYLQGGPIKFNLSFLLLMHYSRKGLSNCRTKMLISYLVLLELLLFYVCILSTVDVQYYPFEPNSLISKNVHKKNIITPRRKQNNFHRQYREVTPQRPQQPAEASSHLIIIHPTPGNLHFHSLKPSFPLATEEGLVITEDNCCVVVRRDDYASRRRCGRVRNWKPRYPVDRERRCIFRVIRGPIPASFLLPMFRCAFVHGQHLTFAPSMGTRLNDYCLTLFHGTPGSIHPHFSSGCALARNDESFSKIKARKDRALIFRFTFFNADVNY